MSVGSDHPHRQHVGMRTTDTGRPMRGSPATIDRVPMVTHVEKENTMSVHVRILKGFHGATNPQGTRSRWYAPTEDGARPVAMDESLAGKFAAAGLVELVDMPDDDAFGAAPAESYTVDVDADGLPAEGSPIEALRSWIASERTTGKMLVAWLAKRGVKVARGVRVPQIREQADEVALASVDSLTAAALKGEQRATVSIDPATLAVTLKADAS